MIIELNIGLDLPNTEHQDADAQGVKALAAVFREFGQENTGFRWCCMIYNQGGVTTKEHTLVVRTVAPAGDYKRLLDKLHALSASLGQDCIGVFFPAGKYGLLVGPKANEWGSFDPAFFSRFDQKVKA